MTPILFQVLIFLRDREIISHKICVYSCNALVKYMMGVMGHSDEPFVYLQYSLKWDFNQGRMINIDHS